MAATVAGGGWVVGAASNRGALSWCPHGGSVLQEAGLTFYFNMKLQMSSWHRGGVGGVPAEVPQPPSQQQPPLLAGAGGYTTSGGASAPASSSSYIASAALLAAAAAAAGGKTQFTLKRSAPKPTRAFEEAPAGAGAGAAAAGEGGGAAKRARGVGEGAAAMSASGASAGARAAAPQAEYRSMVSSMRAGAEEGTGGKWLVR